MPAPQLDGLARQSHHAFDERLRAVERIPENDYVSALDWLKAINELINENSFLIGEQRRHAGALHLHRLVEKHNNDQRQTHRYSKIAHPSAKLMRKRRM